MINLITGVPGSGKTAYSLEFMSQQTKEGRQLFVHGIPDLKIPHVDVYCESPNCDVCSKFTADDKQNMHLATDWHNWAPDGAVFFFDEVQNIYRPRSSGSKVPDSIQAFEVHRHKGLDFYLITQSPKLFDSNIRELISRHIHLKQTWTGRYQYEWPETKLNTQSTTDAIKSSYSLNPKMFDLYTSASLHTKQKRKIPPTVYFLGFMLITVIGLGTSMYSRMSDRFGGGSAQAETTHNINDTSGGFIKTNDHYQVSSSLDFKPQIKGVLESAPAYSSVVSVKDFPVISACIAGRDKCTCYTQQMTVYPTSLTTCLAYINRDVSSFNPFINVKDDQEKARIRRVQEYNSSDT